ncbi:MAG: bis(5'-nucleosyl)-tetraphosphatase (symmetrical) YqeK [Christensenellaceae bacterium]|jgi:predicted HD superfamily hydrolase involved in NAD metabolism
MTREAHIAFAKTQLSEKRMRHVLATEKMAITLAERFDACVQKASTAALLHDIAKEWNKEMLLQKAQESGLGLIEEEIASPGLLHGPVGAIVAKESLGIEDEEILAAIANHTTLRAGAGKLEKILYLADLIEETREFCGIDIIRETAARDLEEATLLALAHTMCYVLERQLSLHPKSVAAYNELLKTKREVCFE